MRESEQDRTRKNGEKESEREKHVRTRKGEKGSKRMIWNEQDRKTKNEERERERGKTCLNEKERERKQNNEIE